MRDLHLSVQGENSLLSSENGIHIAIVHLSMIEAMTSKRNKDAVEEFLGSHSNSEFLRNVRFLIVTSGRGRDPVKDLPAQMCETTRYIAVENLLRCVQDACKLEGKSPTFGAKYALVKAIFGS
jgi:hypothetical protein